MSGEEIQELILVDEHDVVTGYEEKLRAHQDGGRLHRAFSVVIFNPSGEMLLQLRSRKKYHFGGLWSNACCGHPTRGVEVQAAAEKRLEEEFGFRVPLTKRFSFIYQAHDPDSNLTEQELDHVLVGHFDGQPHPNPDEIDEFRWTSVADLMQDLETQPERFTPWFRLLSANLESLVK